MDHQRQTANDDHAAEMHEGCEQKRVCPSRAYSTEKIARAPDADCGQAISGRNVLGWNGHGELRLARRAGSDPTRLPVGSGAASRWSRSNPEPPRARRITKEILEPKAFVCLRALGGSGFRKLHHCLPALRPPVPLRRPFRRSERRFPPALLRERYGCAD